MATILITGISGLVGTALTKHLQAKGHTIKGLSRKAGVVNGVSFYKWNVETNEIDENAFTAVDHIVHLAGAGIADKAWTEKRKQEIIESRTQSTKLISDTLQRLGIRLNSFVGASAIGAYGLKTSEHIYTENERETDDFFGKTCLLWEESYAPIIASGVRTVITRIGVVLSPLNGAYVKMKKPFVFGFGSALGTGKQYMPFIHIEDVVGSIEKALFDTQMQGTYNIVASEHVTNKAFSKALAQSIRKPFFLPSVPSFVLKLILGEMYQMITEGSRVNNAKLISSGYALKFPTLEPALKQLAQS
jgi:uncharacterized protein